MLENIRGHARGSIPPLRMPSPLPHDLCHEWNVSRRLPALYYDEDTCFCLRRSSCIMGTFPSLTESFSNCSALHWRSIAGFGGSCMFAKPQCFFNESLIKERCGNSEVEDWEDCDYSSFKQCYNNPAVKLTVCSR